MATYYIPGPNPKQNESTTGLACPATWKLNAWDASSHPKTKNYQIGKGRAEVQVLVW